MWYCDPQDVSFQALEMYWHEDCLKCGCCDCRLGEVTIAVIIVTDTTM